MQYRDELIKYVKKIIGDLPEVEDVVQDTLLVSIEKKTMLQNEENYKQWLFRIARNKAIDFIKQKNVFSEQVFDIPTIDNQLDERSDVLTLASNYKETYEKAKAIFLQQNGSAQKVKDLLVSINKNVETIPIAYIEATLFSEFHQLTHAEIASKLNIPLSTVKSRIQRTKEKAKQIFLKSCDFEFDSRGQIVDYKPCKK